MGYGETFKALSDPARRAILVLLKKGKMSAGDISSRFDMTQATISDHLKLLKEADLIYEDKCFKWKDLESKEIYDEYRC